MSTTTIRVDDDLKSRVAAAAELCGQTAHAFMLGAIVSSVEQAEQDAEFRALAEARWDKLQTTGLSVGWDEAKIWLQAIAEGADVPPPIPRQTRV